jgi:murein DD-endopeptidase MepM/ murein hydrolase activator NlpD
MSPAARRAITLQFPVDPETARISQSPRDGAGFMRGRSHTVARGNAEAVDIEAPLGTPILAPVDGIVAYAHDASPDVPCDHVEHVIYGNVLMLVTDDDVTVTLGHLARASILVRGGQRVARGDPIAEVGQSGGGGKPHIHLVAEALTADGIDSIPILFSDCGGGSNTSSPRNGPVCRD